MWCCSVSCAQNLQIHADVLQMISPLLVVVVVIFILYQYVQAKEADESVDNTEVSHY